MSLPQLRAGQRAGQHAQGEEDATCQSTWPSAEWVINVGTVSAPTASMLVPAACRLVRPNADDEQRHQQEAATVGEQPGEHTDGEPRREHDRVPVAPGDAASGVVDRIGHQDTGADGEQHDARQEQEALTADE